MIKLERYLVPLLGVAIIFLGILPELSGFGDPGLGKQQLTMILFGMVVSIVGFKLNIRPIYLLKNHIREFVYIVSITLFLLLFMDFLLGRIIPGVYTPTKYGWDVPENKKETVTIQDTKDTYRKVYNQYFSHGFKRWPVDTSNKSRVLIIGDSFTQMKRVSNGEEWYAYLEKAFPDIAFYVFGAGGYGTLQEYMVIDDFVDTINPDAIILQFCDNDYANNYYELDRRGYPFNNQQARPYWENNDIVYKLPLPYAKLREYSFLADRLLLKYDSWNRRYIMNNPDEAKKRRLEDQNNLSLQENNTLKLYMSQAVEVTKTLAKKIRSRVGNIPVYLFNVGKLTDNDRSICEAGDFRCIEDISVYLKNIEDSGIQIRVENDGHWNYNGNKYSGEKLVEYFKKIGGIIPDT